MIKRKSAINCSKSKNVKKHARKFESLDEVTNLVQDPHELILSLVDMGSLDIEDALVACVKEMSAAECKRVLSSLSLLPDDEVVDDEVVDDEVVDDEVVDDEVVDDEVVDDEVVDDEVVDDEVAAVESRIRRLEKRLRRNEGKIPCRKLPTKKRKMKNIAK